MAREIAEKADIIPVLAEIFREQGYAGTSLSTITARTGLGKSSLYHFFPGGKKQMAEAVLDDIDRWFAEQVFGPLRQATDWPQGLRKMMASVDHYFHSGQRICLVGAFALDDTRDLFAMTLSRYFSDWSEALIAAQKNAGLPARLAREQAEDIVSGIQGALVLARSHDDPRVFTRTLKRLQKRLLIANTEV